MAFRDLQSFIDAAADLGEDIDPVDLKQVIWAMCTRADPAESGQIIRSWTSDLDPRLPPAKRDSGVFTMGRMLIDACRLFSWRGHFPPANKFSATKRSEVWENGWDSWRYAVEWIPVPQRLRAYQST